MLRLQPHARRGQPLRLLCIGAHSDDIEIGCGGAILTWLNSFPAVDITWVVLNGSARRGTEARRSARALLDGAARSRIVLGTFRDGFLPAQYLKAKAFFESLKQGNEPDVVLTHYLHDRHQDHRLAAELTWNTWRDHLVLEYEIPKYEGDLAQPNGYIPVSERLARRKVEHLERYFASQRSKDWFLADNFLALMRIRGIECRAASGYAEAFHVRKFVL
jgi:LmbE family N-acetylglucosaminyl deacetylase